MTMRTVDEVVKELNALDHKEIFDLLRATGLDDAEYEHSTRCPLARHITRQTGEGVSVTRTSVYHRGQRINLLAGPRMFVCKFDNRVFHPHFVATEKDHE